MAFFFYLTPIIAILFFVNCVTLAKNIQKGDENTANNTGWGAIIFAIIVFSIMFFSSAS